MIRKDGERHREIFAVKSCGFFWHLQFGHQIVEHVEIGFESYSDSPYIIFFVNEPSLIENVVQLRSKDLVASTPIDGYEVVIDEVGDGAASVA